MIFRLFFILLLVSSQFVYATKDIQPQSLGLQSGLKGLKFTGYFDGYFGYDFSDPYQGDKDLELEGGGRDFTSNPLYDRQFSNDYGYIQAEFDYSDLLLFRFAHHFGDIVEKMYIGEPERIKNIREASATVKFSRKLKVEFGYMPSIFGFETFINKDNMHATRSYMNDFAPDFDAGVRFYYSLDKYQVLKFQVTNGWQVLRDTNKQQALGLAYVYEKPNEFIFNWGQFIGDESPHGVKTSYRWYNNIFAKIWLNEDWIIAPVLDLGWEQELHPNKRKKSWVPWQSFGGSVRYAVTPQHGIVARYDRTRDPHTIIPELVTGTTHGWNHNGYTLTYEYIYSPLATFRLEGRYIKSKDAVFQTSSPTKLSDEDSFLVSQIALSF